jgi:hypothetical protein
MTDAPGKDLIVLCADKNMEFAMRGILSRGPALGLRAVDADIYAHPERDPGCLNRGCDFLRPFSESYAHAVLVFDHQGSGRESLPAEEMEIALEAALSSQGWQGSAAIVIGPELENWVWSDSPHVEGVLGWQDKTPPLREWLANKGLWPTGAIKPVQPKEAVEAALRQVRKQRSSSIYRDLAVRVGLNRCTDRSFLKLKAVLHGWFPSHGQQ